MFVFCVCVTVSVCVCVCVCVGVFVNEGVDSRSDSENADTFISPILF